MFIEKDYVMFVSSKIIQDNHNSSHSITAHSIKIDDERFHAQNSPYTYKRVAILGKCCVYTIYTGARL